MTSYNFGKDITRKFYPLEDNEPINLPSQVPSIYLFEDMPTFDNGRSGIGAMAAAIEYWTETATSPYTRTYTIPAIEDPNPTSSSPACLGYWEVINYVVKSGGQTQTKIRQFEVERTKGTETVPGTTYQDLANIYPAITSYVTSVSVLTTHIGIAEDQIKLDLRAKDIDWGDVWSLKDLKYALAFLTIQMFSESQINEGDDKFAIRAEIYSKRYEATLAKIKLQYDADNDGAPDSETQNSGPLIGAR